jgi:hypothetical protein
MWELVNNKILVKFLSDRSTYPHTQSSLEAGSIHLQETLEPPCSHGTMLSDRVEHKHHMLLQPAMLPAHYPMTEPYFLSTQAVQPNSLGS